MTYSNISVSITVFFLFFAFGCSGFSQSELRQQAFKEVVPLDEKSNPSGIVFFTEKQDIQDLRKFNFALAELYNREATKLEQNNRAANLLFLTAAIAFLIENPSFNGSELTKRVVAIRGAEELFIYNNPAQASEAFRIASNEARCFNEVSVNENFDDDSDYKKRSKLLQMMRESSENLRINLKRPNVNFFEVVKRVAGGTRATEKTIVTERNKRIREVAAAEDSASNGDRFRQKLANCFQEPVEAGT